MVDKQRLRAAVRSSNPAGGSRYPYITVDQEARIRIEEVRTVDSRDPKKPQGSQFTHVVYTVLETTEPELVKVGGRYTWTNNNSNQNFKMDKVLQLCIAAIGEDPATFEIPAEGTKEGKEFDEHIDSCIFDEAQALVGVEVIMTTTGITTEAGKPFTVATFRPVDEEAAA